MVGGRSPSKAAREDVESFNRETTYLCPGEGRAVWVLGNLIIYKVTAEQTGGAYSLFEGLVRPREGMPPHIQHREDECFCVLEGEFEFLTGEKVVRAGSGSLLYVPRGTLHAFENAGEGMGRVLISHTPGDLHERFFEEIGTEATGREEPPSPHAPPDFARIAARYGIEIPSPSGGTGRRVLEREEPGR